MPSAPSIKKKVLQTLDKHIIEQLQTQTFTHIDGRPPFYWDSAPHKIIRRRLLPNPHQHPLNFYTEWGDSMLARRIDRLVLRYAGISRERFGITQSQADELRKAGLHVPAGIVECRVAAPAFYYIPPYVPHYGEALVDEAGPGGFLSLEFNENELFIHLKGTYHLYIPSPRLSRYLRQYLILLKNRHTNGAQTIMLELAIQLKAYLETHNPNISNSAWPAFENRTISIPLDTSQRNIRLCHAVIDYVQQHLHLPLTLEGIAEHHQVSSVHLNRVFQAEIGITLMRYVTQCRLEVAKHILQRTNEDITAIAQLVGFASLCSFDTVFKREVGVTPRRYRQQTAD